MGLHPLVLLMGKLLALWLKSPSPQKRVTNKCLNIQSKLRKHASNNRVSLKMGNKFFNITFDIKKHIIDIDTKLQQIGNKCFNI
jgi:hypothetical protein